MLKSVTKRIEEYYLSQVPTLKKSLIGSSLNSYFLSIWGPTSIGDRIQALYYSFELSSLLQQKLKNF